MKITVINGSARKGNTWSAVSAFCEGAAEKNEIEIIQPDKLDIAFCKGCQACECYKGCVDKDDTNSTVDKIVNADMVVFATPVYWWGMSAQMKLIIDKCYCRGAQLKGKKVGVIICGGSPTDAMQYRLINTQFECMRDFLGWDIVFSKSYYATEKNDLSGNGDAVNELNALGRSV